MYQLWSQDNFSKGELSPYMYARAQVQQYYNGLKTAQNVLTYPTGAAGKRFGTLFQSILTNTITASNQIYFQTFQYLDECIYQLVFSALKISIYLEGILVATVTTTLDAHTVYNLSSTVLSTAFRTAFTGVTQRPFDLTRSADITPNPITAASSDVITVTNAGVVGTFFPVKFTKDAPGNALPTTSPQIKVGVTYFAYFVTTTTVRIHSTAYDAKFNIDPYTVTNVGSGTNNVVIQNTWTYAQATFKNLPFYDFNSDTSPYDTRTFTVTPNAGANTATVVINPAYGLLKDATYKGGAFFAAGGSGKITGVTVDTTTFTIAIQQPFSFSVATAINGSLVFLAEPAWSDVRGWPQKCSSYQNRALMANSDSLPNGFWASVINDYRDFAGYTTDDDDAISWYPSSNEINYIRFIVPFRSITVHTNSGIYSSPLSEIAAITPSTFTLQLQDSTPASVLQPQAIDNQIIVISGNDVHTMMWDGINNAYTSSIVSIASEQVIRNPVDETAFADLARAGSRYVFIVNENGSMAVYQTLQSENVSGFTPQVMEQHYGHAKFLQVASSFDGRCWFVVQREIAVAAAPIAISFAVAPTVLVPQSEITAVASNLSTTDATAVTFTTTGSLPTTSPALAVSTYYWAIGLTANTFKVYNSKEDAEADEAAIEFTAAGSNSNLVMWPLSTIFTLEELSQDIHLDCAFQYGPLPDSSTTAVPASTVTTGTLFNAQAVKMIGDGFGFDAIGVGNQVTFEAHGDDVEVNLAYIGFPINLVIEPMPLSPPPSQNTSLTKPNHIRSVRFMFNNTIGGTINDVPISLEPFDMVDIGNPPHPQRGVFEMMIMKGWDDFKIPSFTIRHSEPFNIELIGIFYSVET